MTSLPLISLHDQGQAALCMQAGACVQAFECIVQPKPKVWLSLVLMQAPAGCNCGGGTCYGACKAPAGAKQAGTQS